MGRLLFVISDASGSVAFSVCAHAQAGEPDGETAQIDVPDKTTSATTKKKKSKKAKVTVKSSDDKVMLGACGCCAYLCA